ncbi:MAG TPA: CheR family methyltransferase [Candidatus Dormibacteraeota bacterium]|nr:CheR family methyltransferase [Candidatus Dormibacteraeota bacterium]
MSATEQNTGFEALLLYLQQSRGFGFTGYKRSTLIRRVQKRMGQVGTGDFTEYLDYLQVHPEEFAQLFNTILINVTSFFRDPDAWTYLGREVLPRVIESKAADEPIRCWCAGVASGEEAYSLAIMLTEALGVERFRQRVKIYATDVDEEALSQARLAGHTSRDIEAVPPEFVDTYFELVGTRYAFRTDLRRSLIFGRHDLVQDAPISRLDLLICRNTLMYFTAETQARVLARLHYALNDGGFLFLGKAEMLLTHTNLFTPVDLRHRVFSKVPKVTLRDRLMVVSQAGNPEASQHLGRQIRMLELVNDAMPAAQIVVDASGHVVLVNERARTWFRLNTRDAGRPLQDLEVSCRPLELRSLIEQAYSDRRQVSVLNIERRNGDTELQYLDLFVTPLLENDHGVLGASIIFSDVTHFHRLQEELERSRQELETTNEELQSTVEELETTNEELQSSNEELETMNEELESTNSELRQRTDEVEEVNAFMESVLGGLQLGVMVVDADMRVKMWYGRSEDLWGLRASEVHEQPLMSLDIGLPVADVRNLVRSVLSDDGGTREMLVDATNRRGRGIRCRVVASVSSAADGDSPNVVLLVEELRRS